MATTADLPGNRGHGAAGAIRQGVPTHGFADAERDELFPGHAAHDTLLEMEALGLQVSRHPRAGSKRYCLLSGRAGSRWFLLPAQPRAVCAGSLAFVRPASFAPRAYKRCAMAAARLGLSNIWLRRSVHVSGINRLAGVLDGEAVFSAFFSGTAGPHRKLVVQFMDASGCARGYAKVAHDPAVHKLLENEAVTLDALRGAGLRSAAIPRVLLHAVRHGTAFLATDALAGSHENAPVRLQAPHLDFLDELARMGFVQTGSAQALLGDMQAQVQKLAPRFSAVWKFRVWRALRMLAGASELVAPRGLAHGDFTPGNTFLARDRLHVFDWEYAGAGYPADFDLIRFLGAWTRTKSASPAKRINLILHKLTGELGRTETEAHSRLVAFHCAYALRGAGRQPAPVGGMPLTWESERDDAGMLDELLAHPSNAGLRR